MGLEEKTRRAALLLRVERLCDGHPDDWTVDERPGVLRFTYDPTAADKARFISATTVPDAEAADEPEPTEPEPDGESQSVDLGAMSTAELRALAEEREVSLRGKRTIAQIVGALEASFNMASARTKCPRCGNVGRVSGDDPSEVCGKCIARAEAKRLAGSEDKLRQGAEDKAQR